MPTPRGTTGDPGGLQAVWELHWDALLQAHARVGHSVLALLLNMQGRLLSFHIPGGRQLPCLLH